MCIRDRADIAQALIKSGIEVWIANHRSVAGILAYIRRLGCLLYTSDAADERSSVDLGGRRIIKKKTQ